MARLTDEELTHLEMFDANNVPSRLSRRIWEGYIDQHERALSVLDRLLSHAGGDK